MIRNSTFKERLKEIMLKRNITQMQLANITGISRSLINKYLKGITEAGNDKLYILSTCLKVNPSWLMGYDTDPNDIIPQQKNNDLIDEIVELINYQDKETLEKILSMVKLMIK